MNKFKAIFLLVLLIDNAYIFAQSSRLVDCDEDLNEILSTSNVRTGSVELCKISGTNDILVASLKDGKLTGVNAKSASGAGKGCTMRPTTGPTIPPKSPPKDPTNPNGSTAKKRGSASTSSGTGSASKSNKQCYQVTYVYKDGTKKTVVLCDVF